ncbi:MAG: DUF2851 family protein [Marinifilaceae bacterium]|jgi:hypothetical protein|nr:DUF2851 family protein [Marinifilaceae bacterium]
MKEEFLQYLWKNGLFDLNAMRTSDGLLIEIIKIGEYNTNSGPDFLNARIKIGRTIWVGNVEIHVRASDWYRHKHDKDSAYNNVILHVVDIFDNIVKTESNRELPTYIMQYDSNLYNYYRHIRKDSNLQRCISRLNEDGYFELKFWFNSLLLERLERKMEDIFKLLKFNRNSWDDTFYQIFSRYLGMNVNSEPFELLAKSTPLKYVYKQKHSLLQIESLLFGQAGFLNENLNDEYYKSLKTEYQYLKRKYSLESMQSTNWRFMRTRPINFPTLRIAELSSILYSSSHLFSKILEEDDLNRVYNFFKSDTSVYWDTHVKFGKKSEKKKKHLGDTAINILLINVVVPILFSYGKYIKSQKYIDRAYTFLENIKPEKNNITNIVSDCNIKLDNAIESQAIIQLKKECCNKHRCLNCHIGNTILKKTNEETKHINM